MRRLKKPLTRGEYDSLCMFSTDYNSNYFLCKAYDSDTGEWDPYYVAKGYIGIYKDGNQPPHVPMTGGSLAVKLKDILHDVMRRVNLLPLEIKEDLERIEHRKNPRKRRKLRK